MVSSSFLVAAIAVFSVSLTSVSASPEEALPADRDAQGCFDSLDSFTFGKTFGWQSSGECQITCKEKSKQVVAINGTDCWCSDTLPPKKAKVDDSKCDQVCPGYGKRTCGSGADYFSTWTDGIHSNPKNADSDDVEDAKSSSSSSAAAKTTKAADHTTAAAVVTIGGQTIVVTQSNGPTASASASATAEAEESAGPNTAGIAAGVVVGVVVIAAAAGGLWFFMRSKKRRQVEDEHKRQAAINAFVKPGSTEVSAYSPFDTRLEPAIMRRMSAGSIADNQDYSRRILKVTNA